ncbi:ABC transporter substrate-binding protein [Nocardioides sp. R1-1]|uniref:ABC transporter substrate-binding protein n=1 Tax=Nocardioides sp. R1-1 TaxID=3383502 RepID=UPI0038D128AC
MTDQTTRRRLGGLAATSVLLVSLTACGGGDEEADGFDKPTQNADVTFSGDPIKVMTFTPYDTETINFKAALDVAEGAMVAINNAGGIDGHELQVVTCNEGADPNKAAACARQAVDEGVSAVVGGFSANGDTLVPILEKAGIPWIAPPVISAAELSSAYSYPIVPGVIAQAGLGARAAEDGCDSVANVMYDTPATEAVERLGDVGLASQGHAPGTIIKVPPTTTDFSSIAQEISEHDCAIMSIPSGPLAGVAAAGASLGSETKYYAFPGTLTDSAIAQAGGALDSAITLSPFPPAGDDVWDDARKAVGPMTDEENGGWSYMSYQSTWVGYQLLATVLEGSEDVSAAGVKAAFDAASAVDGKDFTPDLDFTREFPAPGLNRVFNHQVVFHAIEDGELTQDGDYVDLAATLTPAG